MKASSSTFTPLAHSGKGTLSRRSRGLPDRLARAGRALLLGVVDPLTFLAACDVVVLPYVTASIFHQPQVMLESFAASTPVITTNVGGFGELVRPGRTGWLIPPRDVHGLLSALDEAIGDPASTRHLGRQARAIFESELCREAFVQRLTAFEKEPTT